MQIKHWKINQKSKAMTIKKYMFSKWICFKKIQNKNMQVSLESNCFAHSYFKAWLSAFFPKRGTTQTRLPSTEILNKWDGQWYEDNRDGEGKKSKVSEGKRQQEQGGKSLNQKITKKNHR